MASIMQGYFSGIRRIMCNNSGKMVKFWREPMNYLFNNSSWECPGCGKLHCSECGYEKKGDTCIVYHCGRFD